MIARKPFVQVWVGGRCMTSAMTEITGWATDSEIAALSTAIIEKALAEGLIEHRTHYPAPSCSIPPWSAFKVTEKGLVWIEAHGGNAKIVREQIAFYADNESRWKHSLPAK